MRSTDIARPRGAVEALPRPGSLRRQAVLAALLAALVAFPLLQLAVGGLNYWLHMALYSFMYVAMAASWNILGGYTGYISLGHTVYFGFGGYLSGVLLVYYGLSPFLTAPLAGLVAMGAGIAVGLISLRTRGPAFIIATIALAQLCKVTFDNWDYIGGTDGLSLPLMGLDSEHVKLPFYYGMLAIAVAAVYTSYRIRHSKFGLGLRAISQDETKAEVAGIPTVLYKILALGLSCLFVGMAGALWGYYLTFLRPSIFLTILISAKLVLMTAIGGRGTVAGPVLGGLVFIAINEFFVSRLGYSELNIVATGTLLLIVLMFFPEGIVGTLRKHGRLPALLDWD